MSIRWMSGPSEASGNAIGQGAGADKCNCNLTSRIEPVAPPAERVSVLSELLYIMSDNHAYTTPPSTYRQLGDDIPSTYEITRLEHKLESELAF